MGHARSGVVFVAGFALAVIASIGLAGTALVS